MPELGVSLVDRLPIPQVGAVPVHREVRFTAPAPLRGLLDGLTDEVVLLRHHPVAAWAVALDHLRADGPNRDLLADHVGDLVEIHVGLVVAP